MASQAGLFCNSQTVYKFAELLSFLPFSEFKYDLNDEEGLKKELVLQVRKVIGPFAAPK
jgi:hypothetical protein